MIDFFVKIFLSEGASCRQSRDNRPGTCKIIRDCPKVVEDYRLYNIQPQFCNLGIDVQIVCCPFVEQQQQYTNRGRNFDYSETTKPTLDTLLQDIGNNNRRPNEPVYHTQANYNSNTNPPRQNVDVYINEALSSNPSKFSTSNTDRPKRVYNRISAQSNVYFCQSIWEKYLSSCFFFHLECDDYKKLSKKTIIFQPLLVNPVPIEKEVRKKGLNPWFIWIR